MDRVLHLWSMAFDADLSDVSSPEGTDTIEHRRQPLGPTLQPCEMLKKVNMAAQAGAGLQRSESIESVMSEGTQFDATELTPQEKERLLDSVADILREQCDLNDSHVVLPSRKDPTAIFYSQVPSSIDIRAYAARMLKFLDISTAAFVTAMVYLAQLRHRGAICINSYNVHRLLLSAVNLGMKYTEDVCYSARGIAQVGGIGDSREVAMLERQMLKMLNFELYVGAEQFTMSRSRLLSLALAP
ncbi:Cyclin-U4-1 [Porphyridium purpureum]|uniref:Cyclin-U4-1 n=1 Tax=Porphyridium purpureum TaxID=35688 RepID=A0A5J4YYX2_PORPP|nr:Cyclin-U4-1 [Porphyridium purpureum]|eukprot:POR1478..scf208_2